MKRIILLMTASLAVMMISGCGKEPSAAENIDVESVTLSSTLLELQPGETSALTSRVSPDNATVSTVAWISTDESVATVDAVSGSTVTVTAVASGSATIKAIAVSNGKFASCRINVAGSTDPTPDDPTPDQGDKDSSQSGDIEDFQ